MSYEGNPLHVSCGEEAEIDAIADQFEHAWKAGRSPKIEGFLELFDESVRPAAFRELLNVEIELRRGQQDDYLFRFPSYTSAIREAFEQVERLLPTVTYAVEKQLRGLKIRCPSCHEPIEVASDTEFTRITCSTCGSQFSLVDQSQSNNAVPSVTMMGRFELIERVGVGGFGSVWKAIDKQLDRIVAIKIPRHTAATADEQERFFREARAAAQLRHPNIVSVHEVGRDGDSVYIVSDFVFGVTLGAWLISQQLTSREAAELCSKIATALHHAHEVGVIHRDLKPANIMVDRDGEPHIMDFGLARREVGELTVTLENQVFGTPGYMSPEQARGEGHKADRRSDVYSLGVILFRLLTGEMPFRGNERMLLEQVIYDEPPSPRKLNGSIPRDLETITLKCLQKEPTRRYQSTLGLADDLRRFLSNEPIHARPVTRRERTAKWIRRNKTISALSLAVALALVSGTSVSTYFGFDARQNAAIAISKQKEAEEVTAFLVRAFQSPDPARDGRTVTVAEVLDRAEKDAYEALARQPLTQAALLTVIGSSRLGLGLYHESVGPLLQAKQQYEQTLGSSHPSMFMSMHNLAIAYDKTGRTKEAISLYESALSGLGKTIGIYHPNTLLSLNDLAVAYQRAGRTVDAIPLHERALDARRDTLGAEHNDTLQSMDGLANAYWSSGRLNEAIPIYERSLAIKREKLGAGHPDTLMSIHNLAFAYNDAGRTEDAIPLHEQALAARRDKLGANHPDTLQSMNSLALAYSNGGRPEEAIPLFERTLAERRTKLGADHPDTLESIGNVAAIYANVGRLDEAIPLFEEAFAARRAKQGPDHPDALASQNNLAEAYANAGRTDDAIPLFEKTVAARREKLRADHPHTLISINSLAGAYLNAGRIDEAMPLAEQAFAARREKLGADHPDTLRSMIILGVAYLNTNRTEDAIPLFERAFALQREKFGTDYPETLQSMNFLAIAYSSAGRADDAIPLLERSLTISREKLGAEHPDSLRAMHSLATAYASSDRIKEATLLWLQRGIYSEALEAARRADLELMSMLIESSIAQDVGTVRAPQDRVVMGELRLVGGQPASAEAAIKAGMDELNDTPASTYNCLGLVLIAQGKMDEATKAFREALARTQQDDGTFNLEGANTIEMTAAYFLDLTSQDEYVASTKDSKTDACIPWFYIGQRKEFEGDREAALAAYKRSVELGDDETADPTRWLAKWRLTEVQKHVE